MQLSDLKKVFLALFLVLVLLLLAVLSFLTTPIIGNAGLTFVVKPGANIRTVAKKLSKHGALQQTVLFEWLGRVTNKSRHLKAGEYFLPANSRPYQVIKIMVSGDVVHHPFTIVNGWDMYEVLSALDHNKYLKHTLKGLTLQQIAEKMHINHPSPEGLLYPNTYFFTLNSTDISLLNRAYKSMKAHFENAWAQRSKGLPYRSAYQALIVASMVEKESGVKSERPIIAGVILKRLKIWMPLQIDSTVIYGLEPNFKGSLSLKDLRQKTPYNTYTNYGLPPTPIAMPSPNAIHAALHPEHTKALYFVAKGDGSHAFSATLKEQRAAIEKYLRPKTKRQTQH